MSKSRKRNLIILGLLCVAIALGSVWYATTFNEGRLVAPMDFSSYCFQFKDLPMLISSLLVISYVIYLISSIIYVVIKSSRANSTYTQTMSSAWGLLGFLGFMGLSGFWTFQLNGEIFPFTFFVFFGFFGFYFDGKMSHTLRDERFVENELRAQIVAYSTGLIMTFIVVISMGMGLFARNLEWAVIFMISSISLIWSIAIILRKYLLYRYDQGEV